MENVHGADRREAGSTEPVKADEETKGELDLDLEAEENEEGEEEVLDEEEQGMEDGDEDDDYDGEGKDDIDDEALQVKSITSRSSHWSTSLGFFFRKAL